MDSSYSRSEEDSSYVGNEFSIISDTSNDLKQQQYQQKHRDRNQNRNDLRQRLKEASSESESGEQLLNDEELQVENLANEEEYDRHELYNWDFSDQDGLDSSIWICPTLEQLSMPNQRVTGIKSFSPSGFNYSQHQYLTTMFLICRENILYGVRNYFQNYIMNATSIKQIIDLQKKDLGSGFQKSSSVVLDSWDLTENGLLLKLTALKFDSGFLNPKENRLDKDRFVILINKRTGEIIIGRTHNQHFFDKMLNPIIGGKNENDENYEIDFDEDDNGDDRNADVQSKQANHREEVINEQSKIGYRELIVRIQINKENFVNKIFKLFFKDGNQQEEFVMFQSISTWGAQYKLLSDLQRQIITGSKGLPFSDQILSLNPIISNDPIQSFPKTSIFKSDLSIERRINQIHEEVGRIKALDPSQRIVLENVLKHSISAVEGPPGTGKTKLVSLTIKNLVEFTSRIKEQKAAPILLVSKRNASLDQLLLKILEQNETEICRVGTSSIKNLNFITLKQKLKFAHSTNSTANKNSVLLELQTIQKELKETINLDNQQLNFPQMVLDFMKTELNIDIQKKLCSIFFKEFEQRDGGGGGDNQTGECESEKEQFSLDLFTGWVNNILGLSLLDNLPKDIKYDADTEQKIQKKFRQLKKRFNSDNFFGKPLQNYHYASHIYNKKQDDKGQDQNKSMISTRSGDVSNSSISDSKFIQAEPEEEPFKVHEPQMMKDYTWLAKKVNKCKKLSDISKLRHDIFLAVLCQKKKNIIQELENLYMNQFTIERKNNQYNHSLKVVEILKNQKVIGLTFSSANRIIHLLRMVKPEILVIEEASEAEEWESVSVLLPSIKHFMMFGDFRQLSPIKSSPIPKRFNADKSMFERLIRSGCLQGNFLKYQRRMVPSLSMFSRIFYRQGNFNDDPKSMDKLLQRARLNPNLLLLSHKYYEQRYIGQSSIFNEFEADFCICLAFYLNQTHRIRPKSITILSTYHQQAFLIKSMIEKLKIPTETRFQTSTLDNYLGCQNDYVILSTVSSNDRSCTKFLRDTMRINVAFSRARLGLIVVGNFTYLQRTRKSQTWQTIVEIAKQSYFKDPDNPLKQSCCFHHIDQPQGLPKGIQNIIKLLSEDNKFEAQLESPPYNYDQMSYERENYKRNPDNCIPNSINLQQNQMRFAQGYQQQQQQFERSLHSHTNQSDYLQQQFLSISSIQHPTNQQISMNQSMLSNFDLMNEQSSLSVSYCRPEKANSSQQQQQKQNQQQATDNILSDLDEQDSNQSWEERSSSARRSGGNRKNQDIFKNYEQNNRNNNSDSDSSFQSDSSLNSSTMSNQSNSNVYSNHHQVARKSSANNQLNNSSSSNMNNNNSEVETMLEWTKEQLLKMKSNSNSSAQEWKSFVENIMNIELVYLNAFISLKTQEKKSVKDELNPKEFPLFFERNIQQIMNVSRRMEMKKLIQNLSSFPKSVANFFKTLIFQHVLQKDHEFFPSLNSVDDQYKKLPSSNALDEHSNSQINFGNVSDSQGEEEDISQVKSYQNFISVFRIPFRNVFFSLSPNYFKSILCQNNEILPRIMQQSISNVECLCEISLALLEKELNDSIAFELNIVKQVYPYSMFEIQVLHSSNDDDSYGRNNSDYSFDDEGDSDSDNDDEVEVEKEDRPIYETKTIDISINLTKMNSELSIVFSVGGNIVQTRYYNIRAIQAWIQKLLNENQLFSIHVSIFCQSDNDRWCEYSYSQSIQDQDQILDKKKQQESKGSNLFIPNDLVLQKSVEINQRIKKFIVVIEPNRNTLSKREEEHVLTSAVSSLPFVLQSSENKLYGDLKDIKLFHFESLLRAISVQNYARLEVEKYKQSIQLSKNNNSINKASNSKKKQKANPTNKK